MRVLVCTLGLALLTPACEGDGNPAGAGGAGAPNPDNIVCVGDPDRGGVICGPADEIWDCNAMPNGEQKCSRPGLPPDGAGGWDCSHDGAQLSCETDGPAPGAAGGWDCVTGQDGRTSCTSTNDADVPGAGEWHCTVNAEFYITCEGEGGASPPSAGGGEPPAGVPGTGAVGAPGGINPGPTGGGSATCYCPPSNTKTTLDASKPLALITTQEGTYKGVAALRAQVTFSTSFNDNTYGAGSSTCWSETKKGEHEFKQLVGSDAAELIFSCDGKVMLGAQVDYISESDAPSGFSSLCVSGGDGKLTAGGKEDVLGCETSLDVNLNTHGYQLTTDSPAFDDYKPSPPYDKWIYEVWYAVWVRKSALSGACKVTIEYVHASPACGGANSIDVEPCPC